MTINKIVYQFFNEGNLQLKGRIQKEFQIAKLQFNKQQ